MGGLGGPRGVKGVLEGPPPICPPPPVKQVFKELEFLGWYTTGGPPEPADINVHKQVGGGGRYCPMGGGEGGSYCIIGGVGGQILLYQGWGGQILLCVWVGGQILPYVGGWGADIAL